jgi:hypothetical protein
METTMKRKQGQHLLTMIPVDPTKAAVKRAAGQTVARVAAKHASKQTATWPEHPGFSRGAW